jgi:hypothetical protein
MRLAIALLFPLVALADLAAVQAEPNLERRSEKASVHADGLVTKIRTDYLAGRIGEMTAGLAEYTVAVDLVRKSLNDSGKNARRSPKYFKKAEIALRKLARRLDSFRIEMSVDDREPVEKAVHHTTNVRDEILHAIMGKK